MTLPTPALVIDDGSDAPLSVSFPWGGMLAVGFERISIFDPTDGECHLSLEQFEEVLLAVPPRYRRRLGLAVED